MKVVIISPVNHDGKELDVGDVVDLPKDAATALVDAGAALEGGKKPAADEAKAAE